MKKLYTLLSGLCLTLASTFALNAQEAVRERMIIYPKNGTPIGYWVDKTESVKFLTDTPDLGVNVTVSDPQAPKAGVRHLTIDFGVDVKKGENHFCGAIYFQRRD